MQWIGACTGIQSSICLGNDMQASGDRVCFVCTLHWAPPPRLLTLYTVD